MEIVGCRFVTISGCRLLGKEDYQQRTGIRLRAGTTDATIKIFINGLLDTEMTRTLEANEVWDVGSIGWTGVDGTFTLIDTVTVF